LATCAFDHIINPSKVLFINGWLTTLLMSRLATHISKTDQPTAKVKDEVEGYLSAKLKFTDAEINDKDTPLTWWKVKITFLHFFNAEHFKF
jgi:hypothetical protein